jgi:hypothetical protein
VKKIKHPKGLAFEKGFNLDYYETGTLKYVLTLPGMSLERSVHWKLF